MNVERLVNCIFGTTTTETRDIHTLSQSEKEECCNGFNSAIRIETENLIVTGGTLHERCLLTDADVDMPNTLTETTIEEILETNKEEEVTLYILEDIILVFSDVRYESTEERTYCLPIDTDIRIIESTDIEINDLR
jgi:hypothetical protein